MSAALKNQPAKDYAYSEKIAAAFTWDNAICWHGYDGLTKRQQDVLRDPARKHAADPLVTMTLIRSGYLDYRPRYWLFGEKVLTVTGKGKKAQAALPPSCYRSHMSPQEMAEADCSTCQFRAGCSGGPL